ncbi:MAG TPA: protein kinase [Blastocatellia bacterium]|nr:protein kinase [Blastocatellia bacterium]
MSGRQIGNYLITDYIGGGGFGSVFKAEDTTQPGRVVAIKELHKKHTRNSVIKQRFFQEAVAMARLDHANLPRLFTFGEDNGCYYLVMEFIAGRVLADELRANGPLPAEQAAGILAQVLDAVSYAHRNGIIHRDLKPDNIILIDQGGTLRVKVLDFGIARLVGGESLTLAGEGFGTPAYMSPERMWGNTSDDPRIDVYAIGIILFEMLTGRPPFNSTATDPVVYWSEMRTLHESMPLPALVERGVPAALDRIIQRATAKQAGDRYATADEMLADLKRAMGSDVGVQVTANLPAATGAARLALTTAPGGADVYLDDALRGRSDAIRGKALIESLAPGLHTVRVSKAGYVDYKISVALEADHQTDLQVTLAARATAAISPAETTAGADFATEKIASAEAITAASDAGGGQPESAVTLLAASARPMSKAEPLSTSADLTATQLAATPVTKAASAPTVVTNAAPLAARPEASPKGKRIAYVATAALLIALAAGAFMVFRGPSRGNAPSDVSTNQQAIAPAAPDIPTANANAGAAAVKAPDANAPPQTDPERVAAEKKLADAERKQKEEQQKAPKNESRPAPEAAAVTPATPEPAQQSDGEPPAAPGITCVVAWVSGPAGEPGAGLRVLVEEPGTTVMYNGRTGPKGRWRACGLTPGHTVRVVVFGPRGAMLGAKTQVLKAGLNMAQVRLDREPGTMPQSDAGNPMPMRKRPRWQRP